LFCICVVGPGGSFFNRDKNRKKELLRVSGTGLALSIYNNSLKSVLIYCIEKKLSL
jgi:NAD(P)H-flavin reductase